MKIKDVHIIGAGISGLGCAHFLKKNNIPSIIYESSNQPGGRAGFIKHEEGFFETGGKNFSESWSYFCEIKDDLMINEADPQHHAFNILLDGKLRTFKKTMGVKEVYNMMKNIGLKGSLQFKKMIQYKLKKRHILNFDEGELLEIERKYDHAPITAHFQSKLCSGPLRMFSIIMGGAEPEETYYSNLVHLLPFGVGKLYAFTDGIGHFFETLSRNHQIEFNTNVKQIVIDNNQVKGLVIATANGDETVECDRVICALPVHLLPKLINLPADVLNAVESIRYFPVALINAEYEENIFDQHCQSIMFDDNYHLGHCSANRSYKLNSVRFTIAGKKGRAALHLSDEELINLAEKEFSSVRPIQSKRVRYHVQKHLGGMCAYGANHSKAKKIICDYINSIQGLEIAGDYLDGHNMGSCLTTSKNAVNNIVSSLRL